MHGALQRRFGPYARPARGDSGRVTQASVADFSAAQRQTAEGNNGRA
jgi:hypothetical protein